MPFFALLGRLSHNWADLLLSPIQGGPAIKRLPMVATVTIALILSFAMPAGASAGGSSTSPGRLPLPAGQELVWES